jgi:uncharacterized protein DUF3147
MLVQIDFSILKETRWYQVAVRFCSGGLVTAATGLIAQKYGPGVGGLFLAFPAILPASATLIEKHERERKEQAGLSGTVRARQAVGLDAAGAAMGSVGLFVFAWVICKFVPTHQPYLVIAVATLCWMIVSLLIWHMRKRIL